MLNLLKLLLAITREGLANAETWKVLTKIQVSKSILQLAATNCVYVVYGSDAFQSKIGYALLMRTNIKNLLGKRQFRTSEK